MRSLHTLFRAGLIAVSLLWTGVAVAETSLTPAWSSYVGGDYGSDNVYALATDSKTNTYVGGFLDGLTIRNPANLEVSDPLSSANCEGWDGFVAKVNASGGLAWYVLLGDGEYDRINGLAVHTNDTVYAAGLMNRFADGDSGTDARLTALAGNTGSNRWTAAIGNLNGTNGFNAVAVDSNGYIYAVGYTTVSGLTCNVSGYLVNGISYGKQLKGSTDAFVAKYAPNGDRLWLHYLGGTNADTATACAVGPDGSVYVGGETRSPGWATVPSGAPSPSDPDGFIVKLTAAGTNVWSAFIGGSGADAVSSLAAAPSSSVLFLGGKTASANFLSGVTNLNTNAGGTEGFVVKLTVAGGSFQTNWCRFFGGGAADLVTSLALTTNSMVAVGGTTASGGWLTQAGASTFGGVQDGFISLLDSAGAVVWSSYVGGARSDELHALSAAPNALFAGGSTFSPYWVSGGFWSTWTKDIHGDYPPTPDLDAALSFGFVGKWMFVPDVPPAITDDPDNVTVREGETAIFQVTATGTAPLTYRWLRNGVPVTGPTSNAYVLAAAARTNNNDLYACQVSNLIGVATSQAARLTVISNGTLTVTLVPAQAVSQGACWSINSGATWQSSGASTNLYAGVYTVVFTNLTGWLTPATLADLQVASGLTTATTGVYTAILPAAGRSITGTNVTVSVRAPAGLSTWELVETLPSGLTPINVTAGGVWNGTAHTLTFTGAEAFTGTVSYTVLCVTSGAYTVSGTVTPHPANQPVAVTGDTSILKANLIRVINGNSVTITMYQPSATFVWSVIEYLPTGLTPTNITGPNATWDSGAQTIDWYRKGVGQTLTYELTGAPGTYLLSGEGQVTASGTEPIFGDSVMTIADTVIPPPDILAFAPLAGANAGMLTFTSVANQTYMIRTNSVVSATNLWADCLSVTGAEGTTVRQVPMAGPRLFYRVRVVE